MKYKYPEKLHNGQDLQKEYNRWLPLWSAWQDGRFIGCLLWGGVFCEECGLSMLGKV